MVNGAPEGRFCWVSSALFPGPWAAGYPQVPASIQVAGSGRLDVLGAIQSSLTVAPAVINLQTASGSVNKSQPIVVTNTGAVSDTFTVTVNGIDGAVTPSVDTATFTLAPGASKTITV